MQIVDTDYYRATYPDLAHLSSDAARDHFHAYGKHEGRSSAPAACREDFVKLAPDNALVLEIGPFANPIIRGPNVRYVDVLNTEQLRIRAAEIGGDPDGCPDIHYPLPDMDLSVIAERFAAVVSSHNIEHQPDFVRHLQVVERLLLPGGRYLLIVPDKRYTFDHYLAETTVADVLTAYAHAPRTHELGHLVEHRALTTHNDPTRHWVGDHGAPAIVDRPNTVAAAMREYEEAQGAYIDVHAWKFTPSSFRSLMTTLHGLGLTGFFPSAVFETVRPRNEFTAILDLVPLSSDPTGT